MKKESHWNQEFKDSVLKGMEIYTAYQFHPDILKDNARIDENYGLETWVVTDEHIEALKEGKALWVDIAGREYAGVIMHEKSLGKPEEKPEEQTAPEFSKLECALQSVVWYNGLHEELLKWKEVEPTDIYGKIVTIDVDDPQLQVFWMLAVKMFGDYGTAPRVGWINDIEGFHKWIDDMCYDYFEAKENGLLEDENE